MKSSVSIPGTLLSVCRDHPADSLLALSCFILSAAEVDLDFLSTMSSAPVIA